MSLFFKLLNINIALSRKDMLQKLTWTGTNLQCHYEDIFYGKVRRIFQK